LLEALEQPMVRGLGVQLGAVCAQLHRDHGVDLRLGVQIAAIEGGDRVERVVLADGTAIECDVVLVGIGVVPNTSWLEGSGLTLDNGVVCDASCLAAPGVVACGDVARWPNPLFDDELMRLEHWTNATEQAVHAADRLVSGIANPFGPVPFVWSDQYDCKIQSVGRFDARDAFEVTHGDLESRKFVAIFERNGRISGALGFTQPRHVMRYRALIARRASFDEALDYARK
jgi:NADPH-dependent 2,4-dienoyl-CoA reductase/sulfur reductase-like enzyme